MFDFRFNTLTPFPESGSRKHFHPSGMRGIDFSHKITPRNMFFQQKNFSPRISGKSHPPLSSRILENPLEQISGRFYTLLGHRNLIFIESWSGSHFQGS